MEAPVPSDASSSSDEGIYDVDLLGCLQISDTVPLAESNWAPNVLSETGVEVVSQGTPKPYMKASPAVLFTNRARFKVENNGDRRLGFKKYLPLGSLNFVSAVPDQKLPNKWRETVWPPNALPDDHPLFVPLGRLLAISLIRILCRRNQTSDGLATIRVYVLPDDRALGVLPKALRKHRQELKILMDLVDVREDAWYGNVGINAPIQGYQPKLMDDDSLFYIFNTLKSPCPDPSVITNTAAREVVDGLLEGVPLIPGLKTKLYPYQERSAAMMIQREVKPARMLDPRFETVKNPVGTSFYYDREACVLLSERREYEEATGGILAETMGYGKTLICLAVILQTKGQWPRVPPQYSLGLHPTRPRVASLMQMTAATIGRTSIPWKPYFEQLSREGDDFQSCVRCLIDNAGCYTIPSTVKQHARKSGVDLQGSTILLSSATLVIVPPNLVSQWLQEYSIHLEEQSLSLLVIDDLHKPIPPAAELRDYDVILISKTRFERESSSHDATVKAMRKQMTCQCPQGSCQCSNSQQYHSPLKDLHFLRLVVDEGHAFASSGASGNAGKVLNELHVERKWIISGTPTSGLMGVEVDMAAMETLEGASSTNAEANQEALVVRRKEIAVTQERKDIEKLGNIVVNFLQLKPWSNLKRNDAASWYRYVMTSKSGVRNITSLKGTLAGLVVRHRVEDVETDRPLPPLFNKVMHLEPSYFDKLSINLFILVLTANAITSERVDQDYMFHSSNRRQLDQLVRNMRQSGFYWTGFSAHEVAETVRVSSEYMQNEDKIVSEEDRAVLQTAHDIGMTCLASAAWRSFSEQAEMGMFVNDFPVSSSEPWSLCSSSNNRHFIYGTTHLQLAQKYIAEHAYASDPAEGLLEAGITATKKIQIVISRGTQSKASSPSKQRVQTGLISGQVIPNSTIFTPFGAHKKTIRARTSKGPDEGASPPTKLISQQPSGPKSAMKSRSMFCSLAPAVLASDSPLAKTMLVGTASAKLSYLLDRIAALHLDEKIIVFYEGDHIAWYIAQALELIHVQHLIYAKGTAVSLRASYLKWFNSTETYRVLLMDLPQAAHGLNVASASRIFFVNPVWSPSIEAQAIKRAHRIGQTRPVYVETLVLKNTFEEKLLDRRRAMTTDEHQQAAKSLLDDTPMNNVIKSLGFIPLFSVELEDEQAQMAPLHIPQAVFGPITNAESKHASFSSSSHEFCDLQVAEPQELKRKAVFVLEPQNSRGSPETAVKRRKADFALSDTMEASLVAATGQSYNLAPLNLKRNAMFADEPESVLGPVAGMSKRQNGERVSSESTERDPARPLTSSPLKKGSTHRMNDRAFFLPINEAASTLS
ncbi:hypothetical protein MMC18_008797 [Xylographa bjoerkii]|nr:hypothetical protein [Xylographa bjoerkii]